MIWSARKVSKLSLENRFEIDGIEYKKFGHFLGAVELEIALTVP